MNHKFLARPFSFITRMVAILMTLLVLVSLTAFTVFAYATGLSSPSSASTNGKGWKNISYSFASDDVYTTAVRMNKQLRLGSFTIPGIPGGSTIDGIEVYVEGFTTGLQAKVALSYDGGKNYTTAFDTALTATESVDVLGAPTDTWAHTWNASEFSNRNFMVKLTSSGDNTLDNKISVDHVQVKVYYTPPPTTISLSPVSGPYNGTADMAASLTLTSDGSPIPEKDIDFYVGGSGIDSSGACAGTFVGSATTQSDGVAILSSASLSGLSAGYDPYGACASFTGDAFYQATSITSALTVVGTGTTLTVAPATGTYGETVSLSATLTMTDGGAPLKGEWITFYLFGNELGGFKTNNSGVATFNASLGDYDAGTSNDLSARFDGNANFDPATASAQITINQRPITVMAAADSKVYDGTRSSSGVPTITSGSLVTGDTANFTQTFNTKDAGSNKTLTPVGVVNDDNFGLNYTYTFQSLATGVITPASLTVTADNKEKAYGAPDSVFTFVTSGFFGADTFITIPTCTVPVAHNALGTYQIICSGGNAGANYTTSYVNGTLTVVVGHNPDTTGVFRPSNGLLYLKNQNTTGFADIAINYGLGGDYPVTGDWDGDGDATIGIYRNGSFYLRNSNTLGFADLVFAFGTPGDQPIAGDWNGDGVDTIGVYRPSTGQFLLRNSNSTGGAHSSFYLGNVGDVGIAGDWNGDGTDTTGVFRPSNGVIFLKNANSTGFADVALNYGIPGDQPVTGDWDADGVDTIGVYRNGMFMLRNSNTIGFADIVFGLGNPGDMPIAGDWDGLP